MKNITSYYPVVASRNGQVLTAFLQKYFEFQIVFSSDWYWHLSMKDQPVVNIAIVDSGHGSVPEMLRRPVQGLLLNIELDDVTAYYQACKDNDWTVILPLRDEPWGQRHFIIATPEPGLMVDVIEVIPPSVEFAENYVDELTTS